MRRRNPRLDHGPKRAWWWPWKILACHCGELYDECPYLRARAAAEIVLAERAAVQAEMDQAVREAAEESAARTTAELRTALNSPHRLDWEIEVRRANGWNAGDQRARRNVR